jgi:uncharacterized protein (DUF2062 family)
VREWLRNVLGVEDRPEALARGLAVGFFFGTSILWGLQVALALLVSHFVRGNKVVAVAMTAISNPLTTVPLYGLAYLVGRPLVGAGEARPDLTALVRPGGLAELGPDFLAALAVGSTIVGAVGAAILYLSSARLLPTLRRWREGRSPA